MTATGRLAGFMALVAFAACVATASAAKVDEVTVQQQWPWSSEVRVEYRLSGVTAPVDVTLTAYDGAQQLDSAALAAATTGERFAVSSNGDYVLTIDPVKAFGTSQIAFADFKVRVDVAESPASMTEVLYKVIRISDGDCRDLTRADFLNGKVEGGYETDYSKIYSTYSTSLSDVLVWTGVTNNIAYKTTHIVMRHIKCKGVQWTMGGDRTLADAPECQVILTNDFWIGVFPITVGQHKEIGSGNRSSYGVYPAETNLCPATGWHENIREKGSSVSWPANRHTVGTTSWLGKLRSKTGYDFELPTEAQWEFAARAGVYHKELYTGEEDMSRTSAALENAVKRIAWYSGNSKVAGVSNTWHPVGLLRPNAFGIYDMLGSGAEYMLNRFYEYDTENIMYEPEGGDSTAKEVNRSYTMANGFAANSRVCVRVYSTDLSSNGFRIVRVILPDTEGLVYPAWDKK